MQRKCNKIAVSKFLYMSGCALRSPLNGSNAPYGVTSTKEDKTYKGMSDMSGERSLCSFRASFYLSEEHLYLLFVTLP